MQLDRGDRKQSKILIDGLNFLRLSCCMLSCLDARHAVQQRAFGASSLETAAIYQNGDFEIVRVLILGATGQVGRLTVEKAIASDHDVKGFARSPESKGHGHALFDKIILPLMLERIYVDKNRQEAIVKGSNLDWTLVRPTELSDSPPTAQYKV